MSQQNSLDAICIYEDRPIEQSFLDAINCLPERYSPESLFKASPEAAAEGFIDLAATCSQLDLENQMYCQNLGTILFKLAEKKGFYKYLINALRDTDFTMIPLQARLLLEGLK